MKAVLLEAETCFFILSLKFVQKVNLRFVGTYVSV